MSQNNQGEPTILLAVLIIMIGGFSWLMWHFLGANILDHFLRWTRFGEIWIINLITGGHYQACLDWLRYARPYDTMPTGDVIGLSNQCFGPHYLQMQPVEERVKYYGLTGTSYVALGTLTTPYYRWPMAAILAVIGLYVLLFSPRNKFMTRHTLESFIEAQAKMWPVISPIVKFNPSKQGRILGGEVPDKLPIFAEALAPEEWIAYHRIPVVNRIPNRDAVRRAFIQQLGPRWTGITGAPPHIRALFAAFALKGAQKREESDAMLGRLALAWSPDKGFKMESELASEIDKIIADPELGGKALKIADQFAWRTTALLGVLRWARAQGGVLAPGQFVWVRAEDRSLWYPLNNLGRRSFHTEGAGAMAHFMAEQAAAKPLPIPRIDTAYITLHTYLSDPDRPAIVIPPREGDAKA
ncbi:MAG: hypothetical protein P4M15_15120 [Alphaproteobacteria bacterium]|nr:hypothetical protein [Alphaproteobacteria bacterium]